MRGGRDRISLAQDGVIVHRCGSPGPTFGFRFFATPIGTRKNVRPWEEVGCRDESGRQACAARRM
jgi:hypothetical protein